MVDLRAGGGASLLGTAKPTSGVRSRALRPDVPAHLLLGPPRHGVRLLATQLAAELTAPLPASWRAAAEHARVHLHVNSALLEQGATGPLDAVAWLARRTRLTLTLHDVPQTSDGAGFIDRRAIYRQLLRTAHGWAVSSHHERSLVHEHLDPTRDGMVAPLPVLPAVPPAAVRTGRSSTPGPLPPGPLTSGPLVAVLGFVYPGKGHREVLDAAARLRTTVGLGVVALGEVGSGHARLASELQAVASRRGVPFHITGHLQPAELAGWMHRVDVAVCGHRNVSASGSANLWISSGRRPLVRAGRYAQEMATLRPGTSQLYTDPELPSSVLRALARPDTTWIGEGVDTRPHLSDTAQHYRTWWATA